MTALTDISRIDALFLAFQQAIAGRYSLVRELGRGGMGVVYLAREVQLDRQVAIKLLPPDLAAEPRLRERFMSEARMAARLSHPYIVPIFSVDDVNGFVFYTMAFVDGETLAQRVAARGPLPPHEATRIMREVAWALAYAHAQGIVHRDIKPANILLEKGTARALVTDFGIARLTQSTGETAVGEVLGTPEYMSPEQAAAEQVDGRSDLYSLGLVGYFALTGAPPFTSSSAQAVLAQQLTQLPAPLAPAARGAPHALVHAIERCLAKSPPSRFATGEALADALAPATDSRPEVPVPLRVFLDRRKMVPIILPPAMMLPTIMGLLARTSEGHAGVSAAGMLAAIGVAMAVPFAVVTLRLRRLMSLGYGPDDIIVALRMAHARKREEFLYSYGEKPSRIELVFRAASIGGLSLGALGVVSLLFPGMPRDVSLSVAFAGGYLGTLATIVSSQWRRMRKGSESLMMKFWKGRGGKMLASVASLNLKRQAMAENRPTEMAIAMSAEALFDSFPKEVRQSMGDVPGVVRALEERARNIRARIDSLDATLMEANNQPARSGTEGKQARLHADIAESRGKAERSLAEVVTSLENLRLDLLRLRAGTSTPEGITRDISAAKELGIEVDRLASAYREMDAALQKK
ncbi:MAG TPA: serine/threonine-protein kinase [Gemmatimonadaceae bacterium]|nr:serine/threonine-protein kinase [Gemmatimonadaceae bacterium]